MFSISVSTWPLEIPWLCPCGIREWVQGYFDCLFWLETKSDRINQLLLLTYLAKNMWVYLAVVSEKGGLIKMSNDEKGELKNGDCRKWRKRRKPKIENKKNGELSKLFYWKRRNIIILKTRRTHYILPKLACTNSPFG